jgi:hypothetical protein
VFGPLVQKLWRSIDFSFKLENAYSPENYPIFGGSYPQDEIFSDIFVQKNYQNVLNQFESASQLVACLRYLGFSRMSTFPI